MQAAGALAQGRSARRSRASSPPSAGPRGRAAAEADGGVDPGAEVAAEQQRPELLRRSAGRVQQVAHRGPEGQLVDAGRPHRPGDRDQRRTGVGHGPELAIPARAEARDEGELGQRLGVLDQRGAPG